MNGSQAYTGAAPTAAQIAAFEKAHKLLFAALVQAGMFRIQLARKYGLKSPQFLNYNKLYIPKVKKFGARQIVLEKRAGIPPIVKTADLINAFFTSEGIKHLVQVAKSYDQSGKGIGFIPLIIWAVIAIAGAFTATSIVDETHTTSEEMRDLVNDTADFCAKNNLTPEQCKELLKEETKQIDTDSGGGIFGGILMPLLLLGGAAIVASNWDKFFGSKKAA